MVVVNSDGTETSVQVNGPSLRFVRSSRRRSVASLAKAVGVSTSFLAAVERGDRIGMRTEVFERVVTALGLSDDRVLRVDPYSERVKIRRVGSRHAEDGPLNRGQDGATLVEFHTQGQNDRAA